MTVEEKLARVLEDLKRVAYPDEKTDRDEFWGILECHRDNAVDALYDNDLFIKGLIKFIEED